MDDFTFWRDYLLLQLTMKIIWWNTRNPSPSATTCEASGGKLTSLASPNPTTLEGRIKDCGLKQPQTVLEVAFEVAASNDLGGQIKVAASNGLKCLEVWRIDNLWNWVKSRFLPFLASYVLGRRMWGHPVTLNRGHWASFEFSHDLEKCSLQWLFDTRNTA